MTRAVRNRILKDANGNISDHLRNHVHLTNCIHLKNHMHRHSPMLEDKSIMRDLIVLQRSRSLRDPSASPPSWHSPYINDILSEQVEKDATVKGGRKSVVIERPMDGKRFSGSTPIAVLATSKVAPGEVTGMTARSDHSSKYVVEDRKEICSEGPSENNDGGGFLNGSEGVPVDQEANKLVQDAFSGNTETKERKIKQNRKKYRQDAHLKTLSEQLSQIPMDSDGAESSHIQFHGRRSSREKSSEEPEASIQGYCGGMNGQKKSKLRSGRRTRGAASKKDSGAHSVFSVASNSLAHGLGSQRFQFEGDKEEFAAQNISRDPRNGCGIPFNWSRIHHRGRTILDRAGRSFSCGLADPGSKKLGLAAEGRDVSDVPVAFDCSSSSAKSVAEALPLLIEASGSQSSEHPAWVRGYSGELSIFADHLLKHETDSDLASEARSGMQYRTRGHRHVRHQNLTQKYMPRTFRDMVGQNLVAQALANAVIKKKIGLLYVFYGPHGTGKTSCARIFARALNCQSNEHPKPCGFCNSCTAYNKGKNRNIREFGPVSNFDFESIADLLENMISTQLHSQYKVFIFDDCNTLPPQCWSAISKVIDRAPRRMVFILVSSSLDILPHMIISRCQKFFFPKLKDADIIYTLQRVATKESIEIDMDAIKLIASRSDGSLRDAEMTVEQLSLLGQRISVPLVQELVGLVSDEKLVDLLDLALSADTVNTVKNLREIMETGVEPLALMSQIATVVTDILAGCYDFRNKRLRRKFFKRSALSKDDMEKLRQALKTLSEAEKQLRMSNDKLTWLTAALLQLAPDQQYMLPTSADTSIDHSPLALKSAGGRDAGRKGSIGRAEIPNNEWPLTANVRRENLRGESSSIDITGKVKVSTLDGKKIPGAVMGSKQTSGPFNARVKSKQIPDRNHDEIEEIWLEVLQKIPNNSVREFMYREGKLVSVGLGAAPTVQLMFGTQLNKSKAEKFQGLILQAFESVLGSPVIVEMRCDMGADISMGVHLPPASRETNDSSALLLKNTDPFVNSRLPRTVSDGSSQRGLKDRDSRGVCATHNQVLSSDNLRMRSEIVEESGSPRELRNELVRTAQCNTRSVEGAWRGEDMVSSHGKPNMTSLTERKFGEKNQSHSLVRGKVSLAHVIQHSEGCKQQSGWSKRKAVSIAEKLEQENLRLEPRSRSLLCWRASRVTRRKLSRLKLKARKPNSFVKLVSCGRCLSKSQR